MELHPHINPNRISDNGSSDSGSLREPDLADRQYFDQHHGNLELRSLFEPMDVAIVAVGLDFVIRMFRASDWAQLNTSMAFALTQVIFTHNNEPIAR